ncbi:MAG TPA: tetratricopeptide repeat protein [Terriglobales bacterium]|nr:tetratricopeptide repeat protein [Terriglobales bacterium]
MTSEETFLREPGSAALSFGFTLENPATVLGLVLLLVSLVLYNPAAHHPFTNYDDDYYVTDNPEVRQGLNWSAIKWAFTATAAANWHPLTWLSHELDWQLFHENPAGHHYVNILLHAINVWLLYLLLLQATGLVWRSWMVAALFAVHPINVESVAWIAERKNLLSMFFFLVGLMAYRWYTQKPNLARYGFVSISFALGLMAKPQVITFPFVLLLWDYWPLQRMRLGHSEASGAPPPGLIFAQLVREKIPLFVLSAASAVITLKAQVAGGAVPTMRQVPIAVRFANAAVSYARYLEKAFWPLRLGLMYPYRWFWRPLWPLVLSLLVLGLTSALVVAAHRRYLLVGWLWFLGTLVPMIGLVQVGGQAMADRYAYLPFVGLFLMVCWGVGELAERHQWPAVVPGVAALMALTALAVTASHQLRYWSDNITLWSHTIEVTGVNFQAQEHLGTALAEDGRIEEAGRHFQIGVAIDTKDPVGYFNLGAYDQVEGNIQKAIEVYGTALRLSPDPKLKGRTLRNLAMAYHQVANDAQAETTYKAAVLADPSNFRTWLGMGLVEQRLGKFTDASNAFRRSTLLQPSAVVYLLLEKSLARSGRNLEAVAARDKAQQLSPDLGSQQQIADSLLTQ